MIYRQSIRIKREMVVSCMTIGILVFSLMNSVYAQEDSRKKHDHWAVLVAGSSGFWNYRHQADVCHAYQVMRNNGIPEENIITLAFDDVARDPENPFQGQLFNYPNGTDIYEGCLIDYKGANVTSDNFLAVLEGDEKRVNGQKVLKSTEKSRVFVYFTDHGAPGLLAFPRDELYADKLNKTLQKMFDSKMYDQMVIYIEACESGSMFDGILDPKIKIYAMTASNPFESSWGTYCYPDDIVNGLNLGTCLGDEFSVNWMEDTEKHNAKKETLEKQFEIVQKLTNHSHVMQYGDLTFTDLPIGDFEGNYEISSRTQKFVQQSRLLHSSQTPASTFKIDSRDMKLHHLYSKIQMNPLSHKASLDLQLELTHRMRVDHVFAHLKTEYPVKIHDDAQVLPRDFDCLRSLIQSYKESCDGLDEYSLKYVKYFVQLCENKSSDDEITVFKTSIQSACLH